MLRFMNAAEHRVATDPKLALTLPHDYKYEDGKPGDAIEPKVLFGKMPDLAKHDSPRIAFTDWLTADDNPRFAVNIANRMWQRAFGRGVVEQLNDLGDLSGAAIPGLLEALEEEMKRRDALHVMEGPDIGDSSSGECLPLALGSQNNG